MLVCWRFLTDVSCNSGSGMHYYWRFQVSDARLVFVHFRSPHLQISNCGCHHIVTRLTLYVWFACRAVADGSSVLYCCQKLPLFRRVHRKAWWRWNDRSLKLSQHDSCGSWSLIQPWNCAVNGRCRGGRAGRTQSDENFMYKWCQMCRHTGLVLLQRSHYLSVYTAYHIVYCIYADYEPEIL